MPFTPKVAVLGSGNWGSTVAKLIAENLAINPALAGHDRALAMYVYEETLPDGSRLTETINRTHENPKYLPGIALPQSVQAVPEVAEAVRGATLLVIVTPHEFLRPVLTAANRALTPEQRAYLAAISLTKGLLYEPDARQLRRASELAGEILGLPEARRGALAGPNVALEVARGEFTEATVACPDAEQCARFADLFARPAFAIRQSADVAAVELLGALKNIVALAAGLVDGLGLGSNAKATVIRLGLAEIARFGALMQGAPLDAGTLLGPAGLGDLVTTCYGGRNRRFGEALGRALAAGDRTGLEFVERFQKETLGGQLVQGVGTSADVDAWLVHRGEREAFPLFALVFGAVHEGRQPLAQFERVLNHPAYGPIGGAPPRSPRGHL